MNPIITKKKKKILNLSPYLNFCNHTGMECFVKH